MTRTMEAATDNSLLYGSIAAVGVAMTVMVVVVTLLVRRTMSTTKTRQPAEGKKLMHDTSSWYSKESIRSVPGQLPASSRDLSSSPSRGGYQSQDTIQSPPPFTIPSYRPAVRHYHSPPNPYKQTTVPYTGGPGTYRRGDHVSPTRHDAPTSRYPSTAERKERHNLSEESEALEGAKENEQSAENGGSMSRWHSEEHLPPLRSVFEAGRSGSLLSIATTDSLDSERGEGDTSPFKLLPNLELTMVWVSLSCSLSVTLSKLSNLPPKLKRSHIVVTMKLQNPSATHKPGTGSLSLKSPESSNSHSKSFAGSPPKTPKMASLMHGSMMSLSNWSLTDASSPTTPEYKVKKSLDANFSQVFTFHDIGFFEARGSELLIQLKSRRRGPLSTKAFGEVRYKLAESNMEQDTPFVLTLAIASVGKHSLPSSTPRHLPGQENDLYCGSIHLTLLYQVTGHWSARVKVVILRGQGLVSPRSGGEYRVEAVVRQEGSTIAVHKTSSIPTVASPVWNSPMLFDLHQAKVGDVTLEFSLVRVGRTRRSSTLGRLFVGLDTTESGTQHWSEVMAKPDKEITMWHPLAPP